MVMRMGVERVQSPAVPAPLISARGIARFARCERAWWLADYQRYAPAEDLVQARAVLARRTRLADRLAIAGGGCIALSVLLLVVGLLLR